MNPKMFAAQAKAIHAKFPPRSAIFELDVRLAMLMSKGVILLVMIGALLYPLPASSQESDLAKRVAELSDRLAFASKGQILSVKGDQVYLDMGEQAGIVEGTRFEVVRLGEPLLVGGKVIGHEETIIGEIEILRVREGTAIAKMVKKEQPFEKGDRVYQLKKKIQRVAVAEFLYGETFNDFTKNVQDMLYTSLTQKGMSVVERQKLEEVLREQKAAYTGIIDLATAAQVGKLLGVEGVLVGSVAEMGNSIAITARLVDVEKGAAITASRVELPKTAEIGTQLGRGSRGMMAKEPVSPGGSAGPSVTPISTATAATPPSTATTAQRLAVAKPLRETAATLAQQAGKGLNAGDTEAGQSFIADYNSLVRQAKVILKTDPFVQALEETKEAQAGHIMAWKVVRLAKELELYLTSFSASKALKETAASLAAQAEKGLNAGDTEAGKSFIAEYNLLVRKAKSLFKGDPSMQALEETKEVGNNGSVSARKVAALAKGLAVGLESLPE